MLAPKTHPRYRQLVTGELTHSFKLVAAGLLLARINRQVAAKNRAADAIESGVEEVFQFFTKFENVLSDDLAVVFRK